MSYWTPQACIGGTTGTKFLFATRKVFGVGYRSTGILTLLKRDLPPPGSLQNLMQYMQWRCSTMAKQRWNPKPCACFQRNDVGTILVIGKEIIQFDQNLHPITRHRCETHYQALQESMLLIGAVLTSELTEPDEDAIDPKLEQQYLRDIKSDDVLSMIEEHQPVQEACDKTKRFRKRLADSIIVDDGIKEYIKRVKAEDDDTDTYAASHEAQIQEENKPCNRDIGIVNEGGGSH